MRKLEAIIRKSKFKGVKKALIEGGFNSFNYRLTRCISEKSETRFYRGVEFESKATERIFLSLYVSDNDIETAINIIKVSGKTGDADDSYLAVFHADNAYKLEGEDGEDGEDKLIEII
jgi:nitrogen regulatory protein P-II 1